MKKKYFAHDIRWDTDGDMKLFKTLPQEIEIPEEVWEDYDNGNDDAISDYVSDVTGFCHYGFKIRTEKIKEENIMNSFTAFKYGIDIEDIVDLFSTPDVDEAVAMAEADGYDEVVNDNTGEIVWKKEKNIMNNITIYDCIQLGDTFHNSNGTDYIILAFDKEADVAILLNPKNGFTPYIGADGLRSNHWCSGHYFKTIQEACDWFNKKIEIVELEEENSDVNIYVGLAFDNDDGELYNTKKSAMEVVGKLIDEIIEKYPDTEINISIDFG